MFKNSLIKYCNNFFLLLLFDYHINENTKCTKHSNRLIKTFIKNEIDFSFF